MLIRCCLPMVLLLCAFAAGAQTRLEFSREADRAFTEALRVFTDGRYREAAAQFDAMLRSHPSSHRATAAYVMRAKSLYRSGDYVEAARTLTTFLERFPRSSYRADAEYTYGLTLLAIRRYDDAVRSLLSALRGARTHGLAKLRADILAVVGTTMDNSIHLPGLRQLLERSDDADERALLLVKIGEKEAARGNIAEAYRIVDSLTMVYGTSPFADQARSLQQRIEQRRSVKLAALIPLMQNDPPSAVKEIGGDIHEGILYAVEEYRQRPETRVEVTLESFDTQRDPAAAVRLAREVCDDLQVIGILGPVFSNTTVAAAGVANSKGVPLVSPTANSNGIAATGPYIFQANPDYETRGRAMARYAVLARQCTVLAVLAPGNTHGRFMAEGFVGEALRLGARVLATEWYDRGSTDLSSQLRSLRKEGMLETVDPHISFSGRLNQGNIARLVQLGVSTRLLDSLISTESVVSATALLGPNARRMIDSLGLDVLHTEPRLDSLEYPVNGIQAIYIPISGPEEIGVVASQVVYYNFRTQILGSGEWNSIADLDANKRYCSGVVFESDNHVASADPRYVEFATGFFKRFKKRPSKNTLYGYDVARLVLQLIHQGGTSRETLRAMISDVRAYDGLHSKMGFTSGRVNPWLKILNYAADEIRVVGEINVDQPVGEEDHGETGE